MNCSAGLFPSVLSHLSLSLSLSASLSLPLCVCLSILLILSSFLEYLLVSIRFYISMNPTKYLLTLHSQVD